MAPNLSVSFNWIKCFYVDGNSRAYNQSLEIFDVGPIFASNKAWFACNKQTLTVSEASDHGYSYAR